MTSKIRVSLLAVISTIVVAASLLLSIVPASAQTYSVWDRLAQCESGGRWHINTGNGYYGGVQFAERTWLGYHGGRFAEWPHQATKEQQIIVAQQVLNGQGWRAWPTCSKRIGMR
jgi:hypothetical protein